MIEKKIGQLPVFKGAYQDGSVYKKCAQVTHCGSAYQSLINNNDTPPATIVGGVPRDINTDKWECIARGATAYDIAVELGFEGTAEEWIASLKGEKGNNAVITEQDKQDTAAIASQYVKKEIDEILSNKVDKDGNKVLSANDFTDLLKKKLEGLSNYDDEEIQSAISRLTNTINTLVSNNDAANVINSFNEMETFLAGITNEKTLTGMLSTLESNIQSWVANKNYLKIGRAHV